MARVNVLRENMTCLNVLLCLLQAKPSLMWAQRLARNPLGCLGEHRKN